MVPQDRAAAMVTPPAAMDPLERALSYPYSAPAHSYVFRGGVAVPAAICAADRAGRIPVLACGSNRAPAQLKRKFAAVPDALIPVERVFLADFDSVYAAHISGYGAIAATLQHCPGCSVELFITWLPESLMPRMHATEGRGTFYDYVRLEGIALAGEGGVRFDSAYAYAFRGGCLNLGGAEAAVAAVPAAGRRFRALTEEEVQAAAQAKLGESGQLADFVLAAVHDQAVRLAREARLCADAIPFAWPRSVVIAEGNR
ncbi:MAG TPA: hypothetical protein VIF14_13475 [Alphaproteobacteria bacterium]|jgi:hypothetical protein